MKTGSSVQSPACENSLAAPEFKEERKTMPIFLSDLEVFLPSLGSREVFSMFPQHNHTNSTCFYSILLFSLEKELTFKTENIGLLSYLYHIRTVLPGPLRPNITHI